MSKRLKEVGNGIIYLTLCNLEAIQIPGHFPSVMLICVKFRYVQISFEW